MLIGLAMMMVTGGAVSAYPAAVATSVAATRPSQRSGYPNLSRCASPIAQPQPKPEYSPACIAWRDAELARLAALSPNERVARVVALRDRMGLEDGEGMMIRPDGRLVTGETSIAAR